MCHDGSHKAMIVLRERPGLGRNLDDPTKAYISKPPRDMVFSPFSISGNFARDCRT